MHILALTSSYRRNGNTARVLGLLRDSVISRALRGDMDADLEVVHLAHEHIETCRGCRVCFDRGEVCCPLHDDLLTIKRKLDAADAVVLASPVYVEDVNGIMKNWIDRMAFLCHRPACFGKPAYVLSTTAVSATGHTLATMGTALRAWGFDVVGQNVLVCGALMETEEIARRHKPVLDRIAARLFDRGKPGRTPAVSFYSLLVFRVQQEYYRCCADCTSLDYRYWQEQGWLEKGTVYYRRMVSSPLKVLAARTAGAIVARSVLR